MDWITSAFNAVTSFFGWTKQRDAEENTAPVQKAQAAVNLQAVDDQINKDATQGNLDAIRKEDAS